VLEPKAFKAYDVRGVYPSEIDEDGAYRIGRAYVEQFSPTQIAVGRDMRTSSPSIAAAVREGAADGGANVLDLGLVGTEMVYFAVGRGRPLLAARVPPPAETATQTCPSCGAQNPAGEAFCSNCGANMLAVPAPASVDA